MQSRTIPGRMTTPHPPSPPQRQPSHPLPIAPLGLSSYQRPTQSRLSSSSSLQTYGRGEGRLDQGLRRRDVKELLGQNCRAVEGGCLYFGPRKKAAVSNTRIAQTILTVSLYSTFKTVFNSEGGVGFFLLKTVLCFVGPKWEFGPRTLF